MNMQRHATRDIRQPEAGIRHPSFCILHSAFCIAAVAAFAATAFADLDCSAFAHHATIDFDGYEGDSILTNFPALVRLAEGTGGFSHSDCALTGGQDVRFSLSNGKELPSKVVSWNDNGASAFYVLVPRLTSATRIMMFWGNAAAGKRDPSSTPFSTDDYILSWSFEDEGDLALDDSLSSSYGVSANGPTKVVGVVGKAMSFDGTASQYVRLVTAARYPVEVRQTFTYEGWVKWSDLPTKNSGIFGLSYDGYHAGSFVALTTSGKILFKDGNGQLQKSATSSTTPAPDAWHHLMLVRNDGNGVATLFIDGVQNAYTTQPYVRPMNGYSFGAGYCQERQNNNPFTGLVDELRASTVLRGVDYAAAVFKNVTDTANFMTITDASSDPFVETIGMAAPETVLITAAAGAGGSVSPALAAASYVKGATVQITATPADNTKAFYAWEGNCPTLQVFSASITLPADCDRSVTAVFGRAWYVSAADGNDATADGTAAHPFASIEAAVTAVNTAGDWPSVVIVGDGDYALTYANPTLKGTYSYDGKVNGYAIGLLNRVALRSVNGPSSTFVNCMAKGSHGGILLGSMGAVLDGFSVTNNTGDYTLFDYRGLLVQAAPGHVQNCVFGDAASPRSSNSGVQLQAGWIRDSHFRDFSLNSGSAYGGPLFAKGGLVESCVFSNNVHSAGIRFSGAVVRNCLFARNTTSAGGNGGGLYSEGGTIVENCTFMDNFASYAGGGVYGDKPFPVVNCAFGGNSVTTSANGTDFSGAVLVNSLSAQVTTAYGNVIGTPTVVDAPGGDYAPTGVSASRDAGLGLRWLHEPGRTDFAGNPRVVALPDIGAFEYVPTGDEFGVSVSASAYTGVDTLTVTFTATVDGAENVTYAWDFGDGTTSTEASPTHTYAAPGFYTVALTVTDAADATRTASFEGGEDLIRIIPTTCYVRAAGESTPTAPYATPETAADNLYDAFLISPAKIDVGAGDIPVGGGVAVGAAMEIRGKGPEVTRLDSRNGYVFLNHDHAVMADLTLHNRKAWLYHTAMLMIGADALVTNCVIRDGGFANRGLIAMSSGRLVDCVLRGGSTSAGYAGGITITTGNIADGSGSALPLSKTGGVVIDRCVITNCVSTSTADMVGTGIYVENTTTPKPVIRNTLVARNSATTTKVDSTANYGSGIYLRYAGVVENCTVVGNSFNRGDYAAGIYASASSCVTNTVVWGNSVGETQRDVGGANGATFSHCLAPEFATMPAASYNLDACLSGNPRFKDFDGGDYTFGSASPLLNAGVMLPWMANARDLAGGRRLVGKPDIGCYESPAQRATVIQVR